MIDLIAKIISAFMLTRKIRKKVRERIKTFFYGYKIIQKAKTIGTGFFCGGGGCYINKNTYLGDFVHLNGLQIHGEGKVTIGNNFYSGVECLIITQNHDFDTGNAIPYGDGYIYKEVVIEDFVWLGSRVTILPGTKIGEGAIIQGGAVVHGEIPPYAIAGGNPAKVFKYRDIERFKRLKAEGKYKK